MKTIFDLLSPMWLRVQPHHTHNVKVHFFCFQQSIYTFLQHYQTSNFCKLSSVIQSLSLKLHVYFYNIIVNKSMTLSKLFSHLEYYQQFFVKSLLSHLSRYRRNLSQTQIRSAADFQPYNLMFQLKLHRHDKVYTRKRRQWSGKKVFEFSVLLTPWQGYRLHLTIVTKTYS